MELLDKVWAKHPEFCRGGEPVAPTLEPAEGPIGGVPPEPLPDPNNVDGFAEALGEALEGDERADTESAA